MVHTPATAGRHAWEDWQNHNSAPRTDTLLSILNSLRQSYPHHVVTISPHNIGLIPFSEAKNAESVLDESDESFVALRKYHPADRRSGIHVGELRDDVNVGKYDYSWNGHNFIVYYTEWKEDFVFERERRYYFILYERKNTAESETRPKAVDELIAASTKWNRDLHEEVWVFDQEQWVKSKKLWHSVNQSKWDDVILHPEMKKALINDVEGFFDNEAEYREFAVPFKRGIILHGSPGNGKSLSIKALMHSLSSRPNPIPTLYVKSFAGCHNDFYAIREVFEKARETTPCLLVFEDLDSLVKEKFRSFFLNEVDGLEDNDGLMIIGSTNYLERLDPSITKRPSRFDRKYHFTLPAHAERVRYAEYWRSKLIKNRKVDFPDGLASAIADLTDGFSFAYLKEAFITSLLAIVGAHRAGLEEPEGLSDVDGQTKGHVNGEVNGEVNEEIDAKKTAFTDVLLWRVMHKQVQALRVEMEDAKKSAEEAEKKNGKEEKEKEKEKKAEDEEDEDGCACGC